MSRKRLLFLGYDRHETPLIDRIEQAGWLVEHTKETVTDLSTFDFAVSFGYRHLLRRDVLATAERPPLNLHIAFLPWNKGAHPLFWACFDETPVGVTIHEMDTGVDTGPIVFQSPVSVAAEMTFEAGYWRLRSEIESLFTRHIDAILSGDYKAVAQRRGGTSYKSRDLPTGFSWSDLIGPTIESLRGREIRRVIAR